VTNDAPQPPAATVAASAVGHCIFGRGSGTGRTEAVGGRAQVPTVFPLLTQLQSFQFTTFTEEFWEGRTVVFYFSLLGPHFRTEPLFFTEIALIRH